MPQIKRFRRILRILFAWGFFNIIALVLCPPSQKMVIAIEFIIVWLTFLGITEYQVYKAQKRAGE